MTARDMAIINEISRWRFLLGRHVRELFGFTGKRACDRRLEKLTLNGYLEKKNVLVGYPCLYFLGKEAKKLSTVSYYSTKQSLDKIDHDIAVIDTAIYFIKTRYLKLEDIITEKQLHSLEGFTIRKHEPDFVFLEGDKKICVEVEFTAKNKNTFYENMMANFSKYDEQIWVVPKIQKKILQLFYDMKIADTHILYWEEVASYVREERK